MQIIAFNRCWVIGLRWAIGTLVGFSILMFLAGWQLHRAEVKTQLLLRLSLLQQAGAVGAQQLQDLSPDAADGLNVAAAAKWLSPTVWLLDNQIVKGRVGYDVIVPMQLDATSEVVLVNLGWLAAPIGREQLPKVNIPTTFNIDGIFRSHLGGIRLGQNFEDSGHWPMRIQQMDIGALSSYLKQPPYAGVIYQLQDSPYTVHYQSVVMSPERHRAYALQWFLLGVALLVVSLAASVKKVISNECS